MSQTLGRAATIDELAQELEMTSKQIREYLERARHPLSLDLRVGSHQALEPLNLTLPTQRQRP